MTKFGDLENSYVHIPGKLIFVYTWYTIINGHYPIRNSFVYRSYTNLNAYSLSYLNLLLKM